MTATLPQRFVYKYDKSGRREFPRQPGTVHPSSVDHFDWERPEQKAMARLLLGMCRGSCHTTWSGFTVTQIQTRAEEDGMSRRDAVDGLAALIELELLSIVVRGDEHTELIYPTEKFIYRLTASM